MARNDNRLNKHHNIPLSLMGEDKKENIITVKEKAHKKIHEILDVPYSNVRALRKKMNSWIMMTPERYSLIHNLQRKYFINLPQLDTDIVYKINDSLGQMVGLRERQVNEIAHKTSQDGQRAHKDYKDRLSRKERRGEALENSQERLTMLHELEKRRAELFILAVKKGVYL